MRAEDLAEELGRRPFEPFRLELSNGAGYDIRHPELVIVFPGKVIIATPGRDRPQPAERYDVVSLGHVMRVMPLPTAPSNIQPN